MLVSCLTVTQPGRLPRLRAALADYRRQTHAARELVIVHDGDAAFDAELRALCADVLPTENADSIRIHAAEGPVSLGALRNLAVDSGRGDFVCQWDDDDRYHPRRIELQLAALVERQMDFCFLSDQLHGYPASGEIAWDDWHWEPYPLNFVQGSLLGRRSALPRYPELARGEDTALCLAILQAGGRIARLRGAGWCYVYIYHGANAWPLAHHAAISGAKARGAAWLTAQAALLRERLAEYDPPLDAATLRHAGGQLPLVDPYEPQPATRANR